MYILGITSSQCSHDPSATLIKDGKIIAAVEEERLIREKHAKGKFPINAINFCLSKANITINDIDHIAVDWDYPKKSFLRTIKNYLENGGVIKKPSYSLRHIFVDWKYACKNGESKNIKKFFNKENIKKLDYIPHHIAHAASAFRCSNFKDSMILTYDNRGETTATLLAYGKDNEIVPLKEFKFYDSLGLFYGAFTEFLGFQISDGEWKTMGMAPYGEEVCDLSNIIRLTKEGYKLDYSYFYKIKGRKHYSDRLIRKFGKPKKPVEKGEVESEVPKHYTNIALSVQKKFEEIGFHLVNKLHNMYNSKNLAIAGGCGLNCVFNGKILRESGFVKNIFIQPAANDAGGSLGAALEKYANLGHKCKFEMEDAYLGPEYSNEEIKEELDKNKLKYDYYKDISGVAGELVAKNKVIGWFQGKLEWGPRALGNRSILANPSNEKMKDIVNIKVKYREPWRPFAPSLLYGYEKEYFEDGVYSPFMLLTFYAKEKKKKEIPAVVHVDGTSRPQSVKKEVNPSYYKLIKSFQDKTGLPVILNTSFNIKGEPIVCRPIEAINCFLKTDLDYLAIGNYLVKK